MNKLMLVLLVIAGATGCSHGTVHDYCMDINNATHYSSYNECYSEVSNERARKKRDFSRGMQNMGDSISGHRSISCTDDGFGTTTCR